MARCCTPALIALAALSTASPGRAARPFPESTDRTLVWNDQLATWSMSEAQFVFAATHYVGTQKVTRSAADHLRAYNPGFLVLHYRLGQALGHSVPSACAPTSSLLSIIEGDSWVPEWPGDASVVESWFFHWSGQRVFSCSNGHYLMALDDPGWRAWWSGEIVRQLAANDDDGLFADSYSVPNYFGACDWSPCLPGVDVTFESDWAAREHAFTEFIRGVFAGRWRWIPNLGALITSRDPSDWSNVDGAMVEGFAEWGSGNYLDESDWALQMDRILPLVRADKMLIAQTYPDAADVAERLFILGSYELVRGRFTYVNLELDLDPEWFPEYDAPLGRPLAALPATIDGLYDPVAQVYRREFSNGLVLVNPGLATREVPLPRPLLRVDPSGGGFVPASGVAPGSLAYTLVSTVTLGPHTAALLVAGTNLLPRDDFESGGLEVWSATRP